MQILNGNGVPGIGLEVAGWLVERKVTVTGSDTSVTEVTPSPVRGAAIPVHQELMMKNGIFNIENLAFEELAADRAYEFLFVATHCFQAALRMVVGCFQPHEDYSWAELDAITAKVEGLGAWPFAGLTWLHGRGFDVRNIELMDNRRFAREGRSYLVEFFGAEFVAASPLPPELGPEQAAAARFVDAVHCETRIPDLDDLRRLLADGYLVICNVNSRMLNERPGYMGHFVVVTSCDASEIVFHDPGPPATPLRHSPIAAFAQAWAYPTERAQNIVAVRLPDRRRPSHA